MAKVNQIKRLKKEPCRIVDEKMLREMMSLIGDKWSLSVMCSLTGDGSKRFSELERMVNGISQRMLSTTLRGLERNGIISREVFPEVPPRVEYALTELGESLSAPIGSLVEWISTNSAAMSQHQEKFDRSKMKHA